MLLLFVILYKFTDDPSTFMSTVKFGLHVHKLFNYLGWNSGNKMFEWLGEKIEKKTGNKDFTFRQVRISCNLLNNSQDVILRLSEITSSPIYYMCVLVLTSNRSHSLAVTNSRQFSWTVYTLIKPHLKHK